MALQLPFFSGTDGGNIAMFTTNRGCENKSQTNVRMTGSSHKMSLSTHSNHLHKSFNVQTETFPSEGKKAQYFSLNPIRSTCVKISTLLCRFDSSLRIYLDSVLDVAMLPPKPFFDHITFFF